VLVSFLKSMIVLKLNIKRDIIPACVSMCLHFFVFDIGVSLVL